MFLNLHYLQELLPGPSTRAPHRDEQNLGEKKFKNPPFNIFYHLSVRLKCFENALLRVALWSHRLCVLLPSTNSCHFDNCGRIGAYDSILISEKNKEHVEDARGRGEGGVIDEDERKRLECRGNWVLSGPVEGHMLFIKNIKLAVKDYAVGAKRR